MRLSTSTNILDYAPNVPNGRIDIFECLRLCREAGFSVMDMNFFDHGLPDGFLLQDDWENQICKIYRHAQSLGVTFSQSHLMFYNIFEAHKNRMTYEELMKRGIIASGILGVNWAVTHLGTYYKDGAYSQEESKKKNAMYLLPHLELAKEHGLGIAVENIPDSSKRNYTGSPIELIDFVDYMKADNLGICWDFGHGNLMGIDQYEWIIRMGQRIKATHVADNSGLKDEHLAPYHGNIDWDRMIKALNEIGYNNDFTYEIHNMTKNVPIDNRFSQLVYLNDIGRSLLGRFESRNPICR